MHCLLLNAFVFVVVVIIVVVVVWFAFRMFFKMEFNDLDNELALVCLCLSVVVLPSFRQHHADSGKLYMQNSSWNQCYFRSCRVHRSIYRPSHNWLLVVQQHFSIFFLFFTLPALHFSAQFCNIARAADFTFLFRFIYWDAVYIISFTSLKCVWIACHLCTKFSSFFWLLLLLSFVGQ